MAALEHSQTIETILCRETVLRRNYISDTGYADDCRYVHQSRRGYIIFVSQMFLWPVPVR